MAAVGKKMKYGAKSRHENNQVDCFGEKSFKLRIYFLCFLVFLASGCIFFKLYLLQVVAYSSYKELAENQHSIFKSLIPKRGEIFLRDRDGVYPVSVNRDTKMAYAVPKEIEDLARSADEISSVLGLDKEELRKKLDQPEDMYEVLKHRLSDEEIDKINQLKLAGIHLADEDYRYYPAGELASHILGYVGWKDNDFGGRYGTELYFEDLLKGQKGNIFQNKDGSGRWISTGIKEINHAEDGSSLVLTMDHIIQYETEKILKSAMEKHQADRGVILVMETKTGKILSMASYPNFNPNEFGQVDNMESFRNLAVSDSYEPGSVFKVITLASAIDDGKIDPDTTYVDTGNISEAGFNIKNSDLKAYGKQTMTQVLEKSLNTGAIFAEKLVGNRDFADYVKRFGFGSPTGVELYGEAKGNISNLSNEKRNIEFFTASFGQGISVTPIQVLNAFNAIANGGVMMKPMVVDKVIHPDGSIEEKQPEEMRRVISPRAAQETAEMLRSVVTDGHGKRADVPGYLVGGKTGTAQVAKEGGGGYEEGKSIGSFAGFAPIDNPEFTVLVRIDNPKDVEWAESSAAPAFGELMKFLLEYQNIEPTESYTEADLEAFNATHTLKENFVKKEETDSQDTQEKK